MTRLAPAAPADAAAVFGPQLALAERYAEMLADAGVTRGLIGPRERDRLWDRHLLNCAGVAPLLPPDARVVDLGSGAGLPGLVIAILRPDVRVSLLEPMQRRVTFLRECVDCLGLSATVIRARAEETWLEADAVVSRAVAPLPRLLSLARHLLRPGGAVYAIKGERAAAEVEAARAAGLGEFYPDLDVVAAGAEAWATRVVVARRAQAPAKQRR